MIPRLAETLVKWSKIDWNQEQRNTWRRGRQKAINYYNGKTEEYTKGFFNSSLISKIPIANVNFTKRIIDRTSLVYMVPPIREVANETYPDYLANKDTKLQRFEKMINLLDGVGIKPTWRGKLEYDLLYDYELEFYEDDPLKIKALHYPLSINGSVMDTTPVKYAYWDNENTFIYDKNGKIYTDPQNPDGVNPYGIIPVVFGFREGIPEFNFYDTYIAKDLIATNESINVAETNKNANIHFQSFGQGYISTNHSIKELKTGQDEWFILDQGDSVGIVQPQNTVEAVSKSIESSMKMIAMNYHLPAGFVEGTVAESGVALRLRNQELNDDRRSDIERCREYEHAIYKIERAILSNDANFDPGESFTVDFNETAEILSPAEQQTKDDWDLSHGLISIVDIILRRSPDFDIAEAEQYLADRKTSLQVIKKKADTKDNLFV